MDLRFRCGDPAFEPGVALLSLELEASPLKAEVFRLLGDDSSVPLACGSFAPAPSDETNSHHSSSGPSAARGANTIRYRARRTIEFAVTTNLPPTLAIILPAGLCHGHLALPRRQRRVVYTFAFPVSAHPSRTMIPHVLPDRGREPQEYVWHLLANSVSEGTGTGHQVEGEGSDGDGVPLDAAALASYTAPGDAPDSATALLQREVTCWLHGIYNSVYMAPSSAPERHTVVGGGRGIRIGMGLAPDCDDETLRTEVDAMATHCATHWDHLAEEARARTRYVRFVNPEQYELEAGARAPLERSWDPEVEVIYAP